MIGTDARPNSPPPSARLWIGAAAFLALATASLSGWLLVRQARFDNARAERTRQLGQLAGALQQNGLANLRAATRDVAAHSVEYMAGVASASGPALSRLEGDATLVGADLAFLLDSNGSVRMRIQKPGELDIQGSTLAFRRYFQKAKQGHEDEFAALGAYTKKRGIYGSAPIRDGKGRFLGAAVFRLPASRIEEKWLDSFPEPIALVSPEGVVFASNQSAWRLRVATTADSTAHRVAKTRQYGDSLAPLGFDLSRESVHWNGHRRFVQRTDLPGGWRLVALLPSDVSLPLTRSQKWAAGGVSAAWLSLVLLGTFVFVGLLRIRRAELDKHRLSRRLEEAERLESLGRLAGGVAHDFNNVLTAIIGYASILEYKLGADSTERDMARRIGAAAKRASETVRQLMAFARRSGLQAKPISLHDLLKEALDALGRSVPANIHLQLLPQASHDVVIADPAHLRPAIEHLVSRAIEDMPNGGNVCVTTSVAETTGGQMLQLRLTDTGKGIPPDTLPHVFEPFFAASQSAKGSVLGLASVWGTIQRLGGSITVDSLTGKGTEFRIRLPLAPLGVSPERRSSSPAAGGSSRHLRIVALDDDLHVRETLMFVLESLGHQAEVFGTFPELWTRMKSGLVVDLVVLDLQMPGIDGLEALRRLRETFPELPVMIVSGHFQSNSMDELRKLGVQTILPKPFGALEMAPALEKATRLQRS